MKILNQVRKGFTLIELLIVVAIIGILATTLVPTISNAPARARDAARKALVNNVITAIENYNIDFAGYPEGGNDNEDFICLSDIEDQHELYSIVQSFNSGEGIKMSDVAPIEEGDSLIGKIDGATTCIDSVFYARNNSTSYSIGIILENKSEDEAKSRIFIIER